MQKLKKSFVLLLGICLFSSCGGLPSKPQIELCAHDEPLAEVECYDNQTGQYRTIPIGETDRYIMMSADDWSLVLLYIDRLSRRVGSRKVRRELKKIIDTNAKINKSRNSSLQR